MAEQVRFYRKGEQLYDAGVKITPAQLEQYLSRQEMAMENNDKQGPMGLMANKMLIPEYSKALEIFKVYKPDYTPRYLPQLNALGL